MKTSKQGLDLIKKYEGLRLKPYLCSAGVPTIGYGSTFYPDGRKVTVKDDPITEAQAEELLAKTVEKFEDLVSRKIKVKLTQNQFDALVSHTFNTGGSETLFGLINRKAATGQIKEWWTKKYITAKGVTLTGLIRRRAEEFELYIK